jgi:hypothetical protein
MTEPTTPMPTLRPDPHGASLPAGGPTRTWRRLDRLSILVFAVLLPLPAIAMVAGARPPAIENRPLYTAPPLSLQALGDPAWFSALDRAVGDNVPFRPQAVQLRSRIAVGLGGSSNPNVIRGVGDWLFAREELVPSCQFTATESAAQLDAAAAAFTAAGQDFRFVLAPDKHAIYPEKRRPDDGVTDPCTDGRRAAMRAALDARTAFTINGWSTLEAARAAAPDGPPLYYTQDSHWTPTGAVQAIRRLAISLDPAIWSDADVVDGGSKKVTMDLARQIGIPRQELTPQPIVRPGVTVSRTTVDIGGVKLRNAQAVYRFTASGDRPLLPGRTVIVYDSFFGLNMPRVAALFADTTFIHQGDLKDHPELGATVGPFDRVILERVERGLYATDVPALLAPLIRK